MTWCLSFQCYLSSEFFLDRGWFGYSHAVLSLTCDFIFIASLANYVAHSAIYVHCSVCLTIQVLYFIWQWVEEHSSISPYYSILSRIMLNRVLCCKCITYPSAMCQVARYACTNLFVGGNLNASLSVWSIPIPTSLFWSHLHAIA